MDRSRATASVILALGLVFILACQKGATSNVSTAETNVGPTNSKAIGSPAMTQNDSQAEDNTPTQVYKLAYKYRSEKNVEGLKSVFSKDVIDFFAEMGKSENKSVDDEIRTMTDTPQWASDESRNEKISGDRATIEYRDTDGDWKTMDFIKEGGKWKLGFPDAGSPDKKAPAGKH